MKNLLFLILLAVFGLGQVSAEPDYDRVRTAVTLDALTDSIVVTGNGYGTAGFQITGTWAGTLHFTGSINGTDWVGMSALNAQSRAADTTATENGVYFVGTSGARYIKAKFSAFTSGSAVVYAITTDDPISTTSAAAGGGGAEGSVDVLSIAAGNNNIGNVDVVTLPALAAGTANIGDVDVASSALPTGAATAAKQPALGTAGSSSADVLSVQGIASGTALPVSAAALPLPSGAATAANQTTGNTSLGTLAGAVAGTEMQVDVLTMPTVTVNSHAVTNAGTFAVQNTAATPAGTNNIGDVDILTIAAGNNNIGDVDVASVTGTVTVGGVAAHDAAVSGNPVRIGGHARTSNITAVASGDQVDAIYTIEGKQVVVPYAVRGDHWSYAAASGGIVNTTAATIKSAAGAGIRNCIASIDIVNGHATVSTEVVIRDGAAGTVLKRYWAQAVGGGLTKPYPVQVCSSTNTLLEVAAITTGAAVYVNAEGFVTAE